MSFVRSYVKCKHGLDHGHVARSCGGRKTKLCACRYHWYFNALRWANESPDATLENYGNLANCHDRSFSPVSFYSALDQIPASPVITRPLAVICLMKVDMWWQTRSSPRTPASFSE